MEMTICTKVDVIVTGVVAVGVGKGCRGTKMSADTGHDMTTAFRGCIISNLLGVTMAD